MVKQNFQKMQEELSLLSYNDTNLITLCSPKLSPAYFICSIMTFAAAPCIFSAFWTFTYKKEKSFTQKIFRTLMNVIPAFFYIYLFIPFCAIFHGFQELVRPKGELQTLHFIPCYCVMPDVVESHSELTFLKLFEQIGEALPHFLIALTFYVHHTYYLDIYDSLFGIRLPVTLISIIFSGVSVVIGMITGLKTLKSLYDGDFFSTGEV